MSSHHVGMRTNGKYSGRSAYFAPTAFVIAMARGLGRGNIFTWELGGRQQTWCAAEESLYSGRNYGGISDSEVLRGDLSISSIQSRLNDAGIISRIAAVKDILTEEHWAIRLQFARQYVNIPLEF